MKFLIPIIILLSAPLLAAPTGPVCGQRLSEATPDKALVDWVSNHVPGFENISDAQKAPVYYAFSRFINRLKSLPGSPKVYILKTDQHITDLPAWAPYKGKTLADVYPTLKGTQYGSMPMDGLRSAEKGTAIAVGIEDFTDSLTGKFNVIYHEVGHLLMHSFSKEEDKKWVALFDNAKAHNLFLDDYSGTSPAEYFAQGVEAYLSQVKDPSITDPKQKNTNAELKSKDPELYAFIDGLN